MKKTLLATALLSAAIALPAAAQETPWYLSGVVGQSNYKTNNADFSPATVNSVDKKDTQFGFAVGYRFSPNLAVELGYLDFGKAKVSASYQGVGVGAEAQAKATHASLILSAPIDPAWSVYGRLGASRTDRKVSASASGFSLSDSEKKSEALFGLGLAYAFANNVAGTLEYQKLNDTDVSAINVGIRIGF